MPWKVTVHPELPVVETRYEGVLTQAELSDAIRETLAQGRVNNTALFLGDCTALAGGHSAVDLYFLADAVVASGVSHTLKEALLLPELPGSAENVRFWETTCYNRGFRVRIFQERAQALAWLMAP
jgi:hypothetical protein